MSANSFLGGLRTLVVRMCHSPYFSLSILSVFPLAIFDPFNPVGYTDPYVYFGYFTNFNDLIARYGTDHYFHSRLPWIITGSIIHTVFSPVVGTYVLRFLVYYLSSVSVFKVIDGFYGRGMGYVAAIVMVLNPYFGRAVMWDYPDGAVIACLLAANWFLFSPPVGLDRRITLGTAGAFFAAAVFTLPHGLPTAIGSVCAYVLFSRGDRRRTLLYDGFCVFAGATAFLFAMMICGKLMMNEFLFFKAQFQAGSMMMQTDYPKAFRMPLFEWLPTSYRLIIFFAGPFVALILIARRRFWTSFIRDSQLAFLESMLVSCLVAMMLYAALDLTTYANMFQQYWASSFLLAPTFLLVAAILGNLSKQVPHARPTIAAVTAVIISLGLLVGISFHSAMPPILIWPLISAVLVGVVLLGFFGSTVSDRCTVAMAALLMVLFTFPPAIDRTVPIKFWPYPDNYLNVFQSHEAGFKNVLKAQSLLTSGVLDGRSVRFWEDITDPTARIQMSLSCMHMARWYDFPGNLPVISEEDKKRLFDQNLTVVMMSDNPAKFDSYMAILKRHGIEVALRSRWRISGVTHFEMMLVDTVLPTRAAFQGPRTPVADFVQ
jgi:hypothetical protein